MVSHNLPGFGGRNLPGFQELKSVGMIFKIRFVKQQQPEKSWVAFHLLKRKSP